MSPEQTGKLIAKLRKEAGLTQKDLADALFITDKAVSKWERGLSCPDSSLLPQLSILLDANIEFLLAGDIDYLDHNWSGYLIADDLDEIIAGKPVLDYLISYFMLVGIRNIYVKTNNNYAVLSRHLEQYGLKVYCCNRPGIGSFMIVVGKNLVFGPNLTRQFRSYMAMNKTIIPSIDGENIPIIFSHKYTKIENYYKDAAIRNLGRGMINIPLNNDASKFIEIYEKYHCKIADLLEIAIRRGFINEKE